MSIFGSRCVQISSFLKSNVWFSQDFPQKDDMYLPFLTHHRSHLLKGRGGGFGVTVRPEIRSRIRGSAVWNIRKNGGFFFGAGFGGNVVVVGLFLEKMASCHMRSKTQKKGVYIYIYMISFNGREFLLQKSCIDCIDFCWGLKLKMIC